MSRQPAPRITIRLTPEEHTALAAKAGDMALAQFVREQALSGTAEKRRSTRRPTTDKQALAQVLAKLGASPQVTAFRDAARGVETGTLPKGADTDALLHSIRDELSAIRSLLMRALGVAER